MKYGFDVRRIATGFNRNHRITLEGVGKTDAEIAGELQRYRRQVALYASVVARTTEKSVTAVLMQL